MLLHLKRTTDFKPHALILSDVTLIICRYSSSGLLFQHTKIHLSFQLMKASWDINMWDRSLCDLASAKLCKISHSKVNEYAALAERLESNRPTVLSFISVKFHASISAFYFGEAL